ncbi:hypothetical protein F4821DRAFT_253326 [Hypoxylon rubiginosum]|uniref:Uncharacterized protein n=1 Tax=Hypoxylon rubiginosum TaxID=110542 RepID=A0ACC0DKN4_9PEZI|nr:hypothetical protein F4821DRAFT_253326 [Hypoxylon rubiginosum]
MHPHPEPFGGGRHGRGRGAATYQHQDWTGRSVYPQDAEDLKAHKWFRDIPWDRLSQIAPPFVPRLAGCEDTHYFDEEESISDWSSSHPDPSSTETEDLASSNPLLASNSPTVNSYRGGPITSPSLGGQRRRSPERAAAMHAQLAQFPRHMRGLLGQFVASPYDSTKLKRVDREIELATDADARLCAAMKAFVRLYGRRERKRPRDRLLRDRKTRDVVLDVRRQTAFMGYTYRRIGECCDGTYEDEVGVWGVGAGGSSSGMGGDAKGKGKGKANNGAELASYRAWCQGRAG